MLVGISLWFVPMIVAVDMSGAPEYQAYRDEILFKQTVSRYAAAWHHVKPWYYFIVEVIPALWLPWSLLLFWLVPRFKAAARERDARVWLPLIWCLLVLLFFSFSPGKRGVYIHVALPALALVSLPVLDGLLERPGVRRAGWILALAFWARRCWASSRSPYTRSSRRRSRACPSRPCWSSISCSVARVSHGPSSARPSPPGRWRWARSASRSRTHSRRP
jgi:4-amino-4-deoxy-L-arabinose transferase-like glycosyltransferase